MTNRIEACFLRALLSLLTVLISGGITFAQTQKELTVFVGQSNITRLVSPMTNLLVTEIGFQAQSVLSLKHNGQPIEKWVTSVNPCVHGELLTSDIAEIDARIESLGGISNVNFDTLYFVQGENNSLSEELLNGWRDKAKCLLNDLQSNLQTKYGKTFPRIVIMTTPLFEQTSSTDSDRTRSQISRDLVSIQKQVANSEDSWTYVASGDLNRSDDVHIDVDQGVIAARRLWESSRSGQNYSLDFLPGDMNSDLSVDFLDIVPFIRIITRERFQEAGDFNSDGVVNFLDISGFITALTN